MYSEIQAQVQRIENDETGAPIVVTDEIHEYKDDYDSAVEFTDDKRKKGFTVVVIGCLKGHLKQIY